ncbi:DUF3104 domain-containing protein [Cyanobium sp. Morenito 9A2]|uniref:DUF3104 domain-containing protein n=1 Tax=Cyanobium sp. Morenito 9A2 TaxID=2823718 RepID=UPI0020CBBD19|nr:DUF3104 domain-containing protein [Cyanobium sp. Morenito 9A2]MCP9848589.1 DUF3104 domain-containing protein [Cyanobium sp. Morenito 9A2]
MTPSPHELDPWVLQPNSSSRAAEPLRQAQPQRFLEVHLGDTVVVAPPSGPWWIGRVIHREGGGRCDANAFFQVACVDTGAIRTLNADAVVEILPPPARSPGID